MVKEEEKKVIDNVCILIYNVGFIRLYFHEENFNLYNFRYKLLFILRYRIISLLAKQMYYVPVKYFGYI